MRHAVEHAGWGFGYVDGWGTETEAEFLARIGDTLGFPDYYGANLDALGDCLNDLTDPVVLLWDGWATRPRAAPDRFPRLLGSCTPDRRGRAVRGAAARRGTRRRRPVAGLRSSAGRAG